MIFSSNSNSGAKANSGKGDSPHPMVVLQPGERIICEIKRHPFGILTTYAAGGFAILLVVLLAVFAPNIASQYNYDGNMTAIVMFVVLLVVTGVALILGIATKVYWENQWIVTDDSITQITQNSLFGRRVSQLSMENLEDITVDKHGIIQSMFNFGTLRAETAGERSKFFFLYCPDPDSYARKILEVHESFLYQGRHERHDFSVDPMPGQRQYGEAAQPGQPQLQQPVSSAAMPPDLAYASPVVDSSQAQTVPPQYATPVNPTAPMQQPQPYAMPPQPLVNYAPQQPAQEPQPQYPTDPTMQAAADPQQYPPYNQ